MYMWMCKCALTCTSFNEQRQHKIYCLKGGAEKYIVAILRH